jgi:hypothetical protein
MTYKKLLASTALAGLLATSNAFSQTSKFTGPSLALSASHVAGTNEITDTLYSVDVTTKKNNFILGADINYGFAIGNNFVIGLGATYDFSKTKNGEETTTFTSEDATADVNYSNELKDHYSLYIQPTYVINKDSAMFAKLGRHFAKYTFTGAIPAVPIVVSESLNIEGWGYGLGFKNFLSDNLFVQGEVVVVDYRENKVFDGIILTKPETTIATISVGYKF